jgi:adenylosuccinate synthase
VIANGVVINPSALFEEIKVLTKIGIDINGRLHISRNAHLILPYHWILDEAREQNLRNRIGTTKKGIGPCYADKVARMGIRMAELLEEETLRERIRESVNEKNALFSTLYRKSEIDLEALINEYLRYGEALRNYMKDTSKLLNTALRNGKSVLFEGAQGVLLDVDFGTYPYVTSSNTVAGSVCAGAGISPTCVEKVVGVVKAYTTRVGEGPFPTELSQKMSEAVRIKGREYGATTGRPRRCGWLDIVSVRHALMLNNFSSIIITKLDVLNELDKIKICVAYKYKNKEVEDFPATARMLQDCEPVYEELPGWCKEIKDAKEYDDLPKQAQFYIERISQLLGTKVSVISTGPERRQVIFCKEL